MRTFAAKFTFDVLYSSSVDTGTTTRPCVWVESVGRLSMIKFWHLHVSYLAPEVVLEAFFFSDGSRDPLLRPSNSARTKV